MCTLEKRGRVYLLTLTGDGEHRLNPTTLDAIRSALARVRSDSARDGGGGAALITAAEGKYFSNGVDLAWASVSPVDRNPLISSCLQRTIADLVSLPMPTIAAVTGHAAAGGCGLVLSHDYVLMRKDRGYLYMSEVDIGIIFPPYFIALMRSKITKPRTRRDILLWGTKITATEAVGMGIIDRAIDGVGETVAAALQLGEELAGRNWDGKVYATIRRSVFPEVFDALALSSDPDVEAVPETNKALTSRL